MRSLVRLQVLRGYNLHRHNFCVRSRGRGAAGVSSNGCIHGQGLSNRTQHGGKLQRVTGSTAGTNAGLVRRGLSGEKNGEETTSAKNTELGKEFYIGEPESVIDGKRRL